MQDFDTTYRQLVSAWMRHHDLKRQQAPVSELYHSRRSLDQARQEIADLRRRLG